MHMMLAVSLAIFGFFYASAVTGLAIQKRAVDFFDPALGGNRLVGVLLKLSKECLGFDLGASQTANLGDGNGSLNQAIELRQDFGHDLLGTCLESLLGGNHFRIWRQNGPQANGGALFLAASKEKDSSQNHNLVDDGYNIGRDELVAAAVGTKRHKGVTYNTVAQNITGIMPAGNDGVNHGRTSRLPQGSWFGSALGSSVFNFDRLPV